MKKIVLAYSGGLDTSVILKWLQENYNCEVVVFTADLGQNDDMSAIRQKAAASNVKEIFIEDLKEEFVKDFVFPMFRANTVYEGYYLLGTSIARPLIAKRQIEIAHLTGADAVAHGATGKGNDQIRFEFGYYSCDPNIKVIAPWRQWELTSRNSLIEYAKKHGIDVPLDKASEPPYSIDANLLHTSYEGKSLEDPYIEPDYTMLSKSVIPELASDTPEYIEISFKNGDPHAINNVPLSPANLLQQLNIIGGRHGIGIIDIVENRYIGIKSRGVYETPGGTILLHAHRAIESITLDREAAHLKDEIMPRYAKLIYNGYWWTTERKMLQALIDKSQDKVNGVVRLKLYKGSVMVVGRTSENSLYSHNLASFDSSGNYNHTDAEGFIKINSLRLRNS
ncbi:argininosuccinate synthase [Ehrlichia chaffeensis str. Heartland]|uniref:Argininosuccinate synthase n=1 Tax=Ehrlichia chaffeensis (strain ATCC CRL-10679 / Arkansas) TaxID=205920 RepID=ASSY_EHRCR|nr:argininosuccinate synthase [Ehrlichia chaffeensis]Q2GGE6.1 RecName: Full=Argininosuccinate synthase; AltName: Full=Citrulline--aspartate ligase [Ehrlichia chaffeensis str. Arkansas]ABD44955.1 argininosuccinate synthase [Ehrlichia chaffeensis str. Arkansas]AHX03754.1 argininosuccinate synthase [Ehrlichia chaffeensis str. Heartland]AHX05522.1 argininosuccinate synthase [Ehrlichia chaffeensis str. Jax]AHX06512.1 argininosuccinate synthase [Ehrlichia chaffeensis str. Liberty]AHX07898.1 arginin